MPETVKITREEADLLLTALKVKKASSQTDEWVAKQLNKLADNLSQDQMDKVTDEEAKEVLDKVMEALADDHEIVLGGDEEEESAEVEEDEDEEGEAEVDDGEEEEEEKPKGKAKGGKKPAKGGKPAPKSVKSAGKPAKGGKPAAKPVAKPAVKKGPGVIDTIIEQLQKGTKKSPTLKESIHAVLVKRFPDRDPGSMKATLNAQVPTGLKTEKNIDVGAVDTDKGRGYYIATLNGWKPRSAK